MPLKRSCRKSTRIRRERARAWSHCHRRAPVWVRWRRRAAAWSRRCSQDLPVYVYLAVVTVVALYLSKFGIHRRATLRFGYLLGVGYLYLTAYKPARHLAWRIRRWRGWHLLGSGVDWCRCTLRRFASELCWSLAGAGYVVLAWMGEWTCWQWLAGAATASGLALLHLADRLAESASARIQWRRRLPLPASPGPRAGSLQAAARAAQSGRRRRVGIGRRGAVAAALAVLTGVAAWVGRAQWDPWRTLATLLILANGSLVVAVAALLLQPSNQGAPDKRGS